MCLNQPSFKTCNSYREQRGFLIPLALILLVGISFLAIAVNRLSAQSGSSATLEGLSAQAFYAAESGGQKAMSQLFYSTTTRAQADSNCATVNGGTHSFSGIAGLSLCNVTLQCEIATNAPENTISYYILTSAANCSGGDFVAERTIQISTFMQSP